MNQIIGYEEDNDTMQSCLTFRKQPISFISFFMLKRPLAAAPWEAFDVIYLRHVEQKVWIWNGYDTFLCFSGTPPADNDA